jgi:dipeptidyl aminopeptidase/acylaminoacyl peptidase
VVVVLHGGFWRARYGKWIMAALCDDLVSRGYAAWNLEYRRVGPLAGGGVPNTLDDVAAGVEFLATVDGLDLSRVSVVGHSAGGHLALWLAGASSLPRVFIALAGVADLRVAYELALSDGIVERFVGGTPDEVPAAYKLASPVERVPTGARTVLIHGRADVNVPIEVARSYYAAAVAAGENVELVERDCDHMMLIDPGSEEWQLVLDRLV